MAKEKVAKKGITMNPIMNKTVRLNKKLLKAQKLMGDLIILLIDKKDVPKDVLQKFRKYNKELRLINRQHVALINEIISVKIV